MNFQIWLMTGTRLRLLTNRNIVNYNVHRIIVHPYGESISWLLYNDGSKNKIFLERKQLTQFSYKYTFSKLTSSSSDWYNFNVSVVRNLKVKTVNPADVVQQDIIKMVF